jgi:hypothetical protein
MTKVTATNWIITVSKTRILHSPYVIRSNQRPSPHSFFADLRKPQEGEPLNADAWISSLAICVLLACITKALASLGVLLIRAILFIGSRASSSAFLRFCPRLAGFAVSSSGSGGLLLLFRPRFPLPLAA